MTAPLLVASYPAPADFLAAYDAEISKSGLLIRGAQLEGAAAMSPCRVRIDIGGQARSEVDARIAASIPGVGVAVMFESSRAELDALAQALRNPEAAEPPEAEPEPEEEARPGHISERLRAMNATQKMQLALSADREERMALLRDTNKTLHVYVLKNPRIGLDEVQYAAKMPSLSPDALKLIAEHREWSGNTAVCSALVRNPRTPLPLALRLLDKIPLTEVRVLAKGGARDQIVHAARRKVNG